MLSMFYCEENIGSYDLKIFSFYFIKRKKKKTLPNISGIRIVYIIYVSLNNRMMTDKAVKVIHMKGNYI